MAHRPETTIVVPTIREDCIREFLTAWREEFASARVLVIEDNAEPSFELPDFPNVTHHSWRDIDAELGEASWIVPRRTDCVRSYGYYKAWQHGGDMIVTLDDDCYPTAEGARGFLDRHWQRLEAGGTSDAWQATGAGLLTRGYPYESTKRRRTCVLNHGMWQSVPDYDAPTQLLQARLHLSFRFDNQTIPVGRYFPMCGMNLAFRPVAVPALYFMLMGKDHPYDRFGDIWAGLCVKRICDHLGFAVNSGDPAVDHRRASNVWANLRKEAPGLEVNERLWEAVDRVTLTGTTFAGCYRQLADGLAGGAGEAAAAPGYLARLREAMCLWAGLFEGSEGRVGYDTLHEVRSLRSEPREEAAWQAR